MSDRSFSNIGVAITPAAHRDQRVVGMEERKAVESNLASCFLHQFSRDARLPEIPSRCAEMGRIESHFQTRRIARSPQQLPNLAQRRTDDAAGARAVLQVQIHFRWCRLEDVL